MIRIQKFVYNLLCKVFQTNQAVPPNTYTVDLLQLSKILGSFKNVSYMYNCTYTIKSLHESLEMTQLIHSQYEIVLISLQLYSLITQHVSILLYLSSNLRQWTPCISGMIGCNTSNPYLSMFFYQLLNNTVCNKYVCDKNIIYVHRSSIDSIYFQVEDKNTSGINILFTHMASTINHKIFPLDKQVGSTTLITCFIHII